mgnify:CR=1 FL=1
MTRPDETPARRARIAARLRAVRLPLDRFTLALVAVVALASLAPARGAVAGGLDVATDVGVALLFLLHGAKLSREDIVSGITNWRLHLLVVAFTYAVFPALALLSRPLAAMGLTDELVIGFLFLSALPSTVQSSIAFTSIARGNVPAAICAASLSNLLGVALTPLLVALLISARGEVSLVSAVGKIVLLILLPFVVGHLMRPLIGAWITRHKPVIGVVDRGAILLIVYAAFSASVVNGLWQELSLGTIAATFVASSVLLAAVLWLSSRSARWLGFDKRDEITVMFCGSKKSLASGLPMARVLFAGHPALGAIVLPMMLFHQIQLMVCAYLAERYARRPDET